MKISILSIIIFLFAAAVSAQTGEIPSCVMVNAGKMHIKANGGTTMFAKGCVRMVTGKVNVHLNGRFDCGGNFYQDVAGPVFDTTSVGMPAGTGTFAFVGAHWEPVRKITSNLSYFDRSKSAIAFPNILIDTDDPIAVSPEMAMDARSIRRSADKKGTLILRSETSGNRVNTASLRMTESGSSSSDLVDAGSVVVESDWTLYRSGAGSLFGFASPFKNTQFAGYFAGNWIRRPQADSYRHTAYPLGNKPKSSGSSEIHSDQYVIRVDVVLQAGQAYLIKARPAGFDYAGLQAAGGLWQSGGSAEDYDRQKFSFDGKVYGFKTYHEQLFADDNLFSHTFTGTNPGKTLNWVIGNSYTSAISIRRLAEKMINSDFVFSPIIYVFPTGSTSYQPVNIVQSGDEIFVEDIEEIPAMSVFMIRVSKNQPGSMAGSSFSIGKDLLVHEPAVRSAAPLLRAAAARTVSSNRSFNNQVLLRASLAGNDNVYDLAAVGLRSNAALGSDGYDVSKLYTAARDIFQLYTLSETASKLSANGVPEDVESVRLNFKPTTQTAEIVLRAEGVESLTSEALWLEDLLTGETADLLLNPQYAFTAQPADPEERFVLHFRNVGKQTTSLANSENKTGIIAYGADRNVLIDRLTPEHIGSKGALYDASGRRIAAFEINSYPRQTVATGLQTGIYLLHLQGEENVELKLLID